MKKLKSRRNLIIIINLILGLLLILIYSYKPAIFWLDIPSNKISSFNTVYENRKLLIVKQSSPFKDSITAGISDHFITKGASVEVIDIRNATTIHTEKYDAILIIYRWEARATPSAIQSFMDDNRDLSDKMVVMTTSWSGLEKMKNLDAITGASIVDDVPVFITQIIKKLDPLLK